jgi:hypothetical protein
MQYYRQLKQGTRPDLLDLLVNEQTWVQPIQGPRDAELIASMLGLPWGPASGLLITRLEPGWVSGLHIDLNQATGDAPTCVLNIPISSCLGVSMDWYRPKSPELVTSFLGAMYIPSPYLREQDAEFIETKPFDGHCFLADPSQFHRVKNLGTERAYIISYRHRPWAYGSIWDDLPLWLDEW